MWIGTTVAQTRPMEENEIPVNCGRCGKAMVVRIDDVRELRTITPHSRAANYLPATSFQSPMTLPHRILSGLALLPSWSLKTKPLSV
jgi:hypothetical protein